MGWKQPFQKVGRFGESILDRVLCVLGAVFFSQAPEFMQQYLQRLGGHLDEASRQLQQFERAAEQTGQTVRAFAAHAQVSTDQTMVKMGEIATRAIERVDELASAELALRTATPWSRPFVFLEHLDMEIARGAWSVFKPAVPTTLEGAMYAGAGMIVFLALYYGAIKTPVETLIARRRGRRRELAAAVAAKRSG